MSSHARVAARSLLLVVGSVATSVLFWEAALPQRSGAAHGWINPDAYFYTVPALRFGVRLLRSHVIPFWDPYQQCGTAYLAAQHHGLLYPPFWLALIVPVAQALRYVLFAHYALAMAAAFWCARVFGCSAGPALLAAIGYAFSGTLITLGTAEMPALLVSAAWLPVQLGCTRAWLTRAPWGWYAVALGVAFAMVLLGGHPQYVLISAQVCGFYLLAGCAQRLFYGPLPLVAMRCRRKSLTREHHVLNRKRLTRLLGAPGVGLARLGGGLLLAGVVAAGISAVQTLPTAELMLRSPRSPGMLAGPGNLLLSGWRSPAMLLQGIVTPTNVFGATSDGHLPLLLLLLAPLALWPGRTRRRALFLWVLAVASAYVALGERTFAYAWYLRLPGATLFRFPARLQVVTTLCLSLLGALGAEALLRSTGRGKTVSALGAATVTLGLCVWLAGTTLWATSSMRNSLIWVGAWAVLLALVRRGGTMQMRALVVVAAAAMLGDVYTSIGALPSLPANHPDALPQPTAAAAYIRERQGYDRTYNTCAPAKWGRRPPGTLLKIGMDAGLYAVNDNEKLFDERYAKVLAQLGNEGWDTTLGGGARATTIDGHELALLRVLGVRFVLVSHEEHITVPWAEPAYRDAAYDVYELPTPVPRTYVARSVHPGASRAEAEAVLRDDPRFILDGGAVIEAPLLDQRGSQGSAEIRRYEPQLVEIEATLSSPGVVVLQDQFDPFWRVTVDGRAARLLRTNFVFRGVEVDAGHHVIQFRYRPWLFGVGAALSGITLVGLAIYGWRALTSSSRGCAAVRASRHREKPVGR